MAESTTWTREREEFLRELHSSGLTFGEIAQRLGGVSRNAVIGKANRLGLRFKTASRPGLSGEAKAPHGKASGAASRKRPESAARPVRAHPPVSAPRKPEAPQRPPRVPEFRVLDKYYSGRKRRSAVRKAPPQPGSGAASGALQKYFAATERAAKARRSRSEREQRALIRAREAEEARALREAERSGKARAQKAELSRSDRLAATRAGEDAAAAMRSPPDFPAAAGLRELGSGDAVRASGTSRLEADSAAPSAGEGLRAREPLRIPLVALTEATCRWPLGDPEAGDFAFCGLPSLPRKPYCEDHAKLAYQPMASRRPRERDAGK